MFVTFYYNSSPNNAVNKSLTITQNQFPCTMKSPVSLVSPEIIVNTSTMNMGGNTNYMYIDTFDRYYFINDYMILDGGRILVRGSIDVLYTYRNNILSSVANVVRQENAGINTITDKCLPLSTTRGLKVYRFPEQLNNANFSETTPCFILTVAGGGNTSTRVAETQPETE